MKKFTLTILLCALSCACHSEDTKKQVIGQKTVATDDRGTDYYSYPTKFGKIEFVDRTGRQAALATRILLNGKALVNMEGVADKGGFEQSLMVDDVVNPIDRVPRRPNQVGQTDVNRMVVSIGPTANCIRRYVMLDFTGAKPFASKPFSYNPDDDLCEHLKKVKWGKQETYIDLSGPQRYIYRPYSEVIGPVDD